jgi:hypothetical protein
MATTRQPRQFLAVWNDDGITVKGATFEESLFVDDVFWKNELTPVAPESFGEFGTMFSNQLQIQHAALVAQKATLLSEKAALETEKATLENQLATKTEQVNALTQEKATLTEQLTAANARIAILLSGMPWNPRVMESSAFIARISSQELLLLASSSDPMLQQIIGMLNQWKANDWPIVLDSPEIQQAVGYLAQQGVFAESRIAEVLRDCTREESYVADE